jgi:hypothetical protein
MGLLAAAVREYKQHRRQRVVVVANLEPRPDVELSEKQIATIQHQAVGINATAPCARQGCCGRAYSDCATCGRANTSKCRQRKCYRRQSGGGGGCCGGKRRPARVPEAATVYPTAREVETAPFSVQEQGVADDGPEKREGGYLAANRAFGGEFKGNDKEFEAGSVDDHGSRAEQFVELPPYQG